MYINHFDLFLSRSFLSVLCVVDCITLVGTLYDDFFVCDDSVEGLGVPWSLFGLANVANPRSDASQS